MVHLAIVRLAAPGSAGKIASYATAVTRRKMSWKTNPMMPTTSSTPAYQSSGRTNRSLRRPAAMAPIDIPPRKIARTMICAYALWPTNSPR